jgi:hypothetical protein
MLFRCVTKLLRTYERIRVSRVGEHSCTPLFVVNSLTDCCWRQRLSVFGFLQFLFFFLKKVAQVAIRGNKTEPKMAINSDKMRKKLSITIY